MARVTIDDCLEKIPNRFAIVKMTAQRVKQMREGSERLIKNEENEDVVAALKEISAGKVNLRNKKK